jgi:hypothetical protein
MLALDEVPPADPPTRDVGSGFDHMSRSLRSKPDADVARERQATRHTSD